MKLKFSSLAVCRTPLFTLDHDLKEVWDELKHCIQDASPDFYSKIRELSLTELEQADPKVKFTVWKYFNRAKYRSTPFGRFAAFSSFFLYPSHEEQQTLIAEQPVLHHFTSWLEKENINVKGRGGLKDIQSLQLNHSIYPSGNELRYIIIADGQFKIAAIDQSAIMTGLIQFCADEQSKIAVLEFLAHTFGVEPVAGTAFITHLVDLQLLFTDWQPNITGMDYFKRINYTKKTKHADYVISERKIGPESISIGQLKILPELVSFLGNVLPQEPSVPLSDFKKAFLKKFEYREVPLLTALDPEMGVGYHHLERAEQGYTILEGLTSAMEKERHTPKISYTPFHQFLLNKMVKDETIQLEDYHGSNGAADPKFPNTLSVLFEVSDGKIIFAGGGGATSNALNGRFTFASDALEQDGIKMADLERNANPGVLFFDIAYHAERQVDNINRRKLLYPYELPILTWSTSKNPIALSDLWVSIRHDEVILRSKKHQQRILPRIASAYNYTRSDLSVYRFLCDIQHQNILVNFNVQLRDRFPGLDTYPRIQYKGIVLSPAAWLVPENLIREKDQSPDKLKAWLSQKEIGNYFSAGYNDQTLCFDSSNHKDLMAFLQYCKGDKNPVYIQEAFVPKESMVRDQIGRPFKAQFVVNLVHNECIYHPETENNWRYKHDVQSLKMPGEWLYFEIYSHWQRRNSLLLSVISPYLKSIGKKISNWFFIKYDDPTSHLRLRLQLKQGVNGADLIEKLAVLLSADLQTGLISDFKIKLYLRETERYGLENIEAVEKCFGLDSHYALKFIQSGFNEETQYVYILQFIEEVMSGCKWDAADKANIVKSIAGNFAEEMKIGTRQYKMINKNYQSLIRLGTNKTKGKELEKRSAQLVTECCKTIMNCSIQFKTNVFADLMHMHINRLFPSDQRVHEMVIYQFLMMKLKGKESEKEI